MLTYILAAIGIVLYFFKLPTVTVICAIYCLLSSVSWMFRGKPKELIEKLFVSIFTAIIALITKGNIIWYVSFSICLETVWDFFRFVNMISKVSHLNNDDNIDCNSDQNKRS